MPKKITKATEEVIKEGEKVNAGLTEEQMTGLAHTAWRYRLQGYTYKEIADMIGYHPTMVKNYIKRIHEDYKQEVWHDVEDYRYDLAARLEYMSAETQRQWEQAKMRDEITPDHIKYLESTRKMIGDIRDLFGLDAPKRTETQVSTGDQPYTITIDMSGVTK